MTDGMEKRKRGRKKGSGSYVYFVLDRRTNKWGVYRFIGRLCHEFDIDYQKLLANDFSRNEFMDDGRYLIAAAPLEIRGFGATVQNYDSAMRTIYNRAVERIVEKNRLEDIKANRFKDDKTRTRKPRHYYQR